MEILLNTANIIGYFLILTGFLFLISLATKLILSKKPVKSVLYKFLTYLGLLIIGLITTYVVSLHTINLNTVNVMSSSVKNPKAITLNLHQGAEVKYLYNKKDVEIRFENGNPSFKIKATENKTIKIVTVQNYKNSFLVNTINRTKTVINYSY